MTGEKLSAEFCKSPNSDTDAENIQLGNLTKVSDGAHSEILVKIQVFLSS